MVARLIIDLVSIIKIQIFAFFYIFKHCLKDIVAQFVVIKRHYNKSRKETA